jgi:hypothetical protein
MGTLGDPKPPLIPQAAINRRFRTSPETVYHPVESRPSMDPSRAPHLAALDRTPAFTTVHAGSSWPRASPLYSGPFGSPPPSRLLRRPSIGTDRARVPPLLASAVSPTPSPTGAPVRPSCPSSSGAVVLYRGHIGSQHLTLHAMDMGRKELHISHL